MQVLKVTQEQREACPRPCTSQPQVTLSGSYLISNP